MYTCSGERFVAEAIASARSSLRHNSVPHLIYASPVPANAPPESGLSIEPFEPSGNPYLDKVANIRRSPFERTIFLDTDTFVAGEITHLLQLLDQYDVAAAHAPGYRASPDPDVPEAFYEFNTGVLAWRSNERTEAFMANWEATMSDWLRDEPFPGATTTGGRDADQPSFRHCAWKHGLRLIVIGAEYNLRITKPATVVEQVRVLHGRHRDPETLARRLNRGQGPRQFLPGRPWTVARSILGTLRRR